MKNKSLMILSVMLVAFSACNNITDDVTSAKTTDSIMVAWIDAWNQADVDKINSFFTDDAVLITDTILYGKGSINTGFVIPAAAMLRNLTVKNLKIETTNTLASISGSYDHDWVDHDTVVGHAVGYYTFLWKKQDDNSWKLAVTNMN